MNKLYLGFIILIAGIIEVVSGCCSWNYTKEDFEFTKEELNPILAYKIGDTIYFESNLGDIDTITVVEIFEERQAGNKCFIARVPLHSKCVNIKHLPNDKWAGTLQTEGEEQKISYQSLISISKSPLDSIKKIAGYAIRFKEFTTLGNALNVAPRDFTINGKTIYECYKISHGYPERVISSNDIEIIYWTTKYGLTGYSSKAGETWLLRNLY